MATYTSVQDGNLTDPRTWGGNADASHFAQAVGITSGTLNATDLDLVRNADGQKMVVTELAGQQWRVWFDFNAVPASLLDIHIHVKGHYDGNVVHVVKPQIYNWNSATWRTINATFESIATDLQYEFYASVLASEISGGQMRIGVYHSTAGAPLHYFYIDKFFMETHDPRPNTDGDILSIQHDVLYDYGVTPTRWGDITITQTPTVGTLRFPTNSNSRLDILHNSIFYVYGNLFVGYPATPINADNHASLVWHQTPEVLQALVIAGTTAKARFYGSRDFYSDIMSATLAQTWDMGATLYVTGNVKNKWRAGQRIGVCTNNGYGAWNTDVEVYHIATILSPVAGNTPIRVVEPNIYATYLAGGPVANLSRNVSLYDLGNNASELKPYMRVGYTQSGLVLESTIYGRDAVIANNTAMYSFYSLFDFSGNNKFTDCTLWKYYRSRYRSCEWHKRCVFLGVYYLDYQQVSGLQYDDCLMLGIGYLEYYTSGSRFNNCNMWHLAQLSYSVGAGMYIYGGEIRNTYGLANYTSGIVVDGCRCEFNVAILANAGVNILFKDSDITLDGIYLDRTNVHDKKLYFSNCLVNNASIIYAVRTNAGDVLPITNTASRWQTPPSNNNWILECNVATPIVNSDHHPTLIRLFEEKNSYAYCRANIEQTLSFYVYPSGWRGELSGSEILLYANYKNSATSMITTRVYSNATLPNDKWKAVSVTFTPKQNDVIYFNMDIRTHYEATPYILIDPRWVLE